MYIDFSKIVTDDLRETISEEKLAYLKLLANKEKTYLNGKYAQNSLKLLLSKKANEIVYVNARYQSANKVEKALIACNIVFDDEKIIKILNCGQFDKETIVTFIRVLNYLQDKVMNNTLTESDKKYLNYANNYAKKLGAHFSKFIGGCEIDIVINKINEILSFNPELFGLTKNKHKR